MDLVALAAAPLVAYLVVAGMVSLDAAFPAVPSDGAVVAAGALAAAGHLNVVWCAVAVVAGSMTGDHLVYRIARHRLPGVLSRREFGRRLQRRAEHAVGTAQGVATGALAMGRFVPFGRTAAAATAGVAGVRPRRYVLISLFGAAAWASWLVGLGYVTGDVIGGPMWRQVLVATAVGLAAAAVVAGVTRLVASRRAREHVSTSAQACTVSNPEEV